MQPCAAHAGPGASGTHEVLESITLTAEERELLETLLGAAKAAGTGTVLRCAGGWVRDKLLGKESSDIDVALDNTMGRQFADVVNTHLLSLGRESRHAAVIESNPDQSKHLETARMKVNGMWIDLVNLRSETYAEDSRIPTVEFGTPEQDALRRDFTINAMFYNINTGCVEDLTGRGMDDLRAGIIRTPLTPMETFLDDPLRVLRAVRFGTRFGFELEQTLVEAASSQQVCIALANKVSKERVGTELEGMVNGPDPVGAVRLLDRLSLFTTVFALPEPQASLLPRALVARTCIACVRGAAQLASSLGLSLDKEDNRALLLAALLLPLRQMTVAGPKNKPMAATTFVVRESIKWRIKDAESTLALHEAAGEMARVAAMLTDGGGLPVAPGSVGMAGVDGEGVGGVDDGGDTVVRVALGNAIRKLKQQWRLGVVTAALLSMRASAPLSAGDASPSVPAHCGSTSGGGGGDGDEGGAELGAAAAAAREEVAHVLLSAAAAFGLEECWQWKPLMDGKQVMSLLGIKGGPSLGKAVQEVMDWQLSHPGGTLEQAQAHLLAVHTAAAGGAPPS
ncbi:hypothetical protein FOA52_007211 [Chlamydomonas sp. UWO 241]|nr:hypothetical protein FOA52_007211 [Chlamydomonas sp. UWO 241]